MAGFDESRKRSYSGPERGRASSVWGEVQVEVYRYPTVADADDVVRANARYPSTCPRVTEWTCEECDGITTTARQRVSFAPVGVQSIAWRFRAVDNFKHNGFTVVARRGVTVVRVTTGRGRMPTSSTFRYPPLVSKDRAERVARLALRLAMPG
jgi:hypothetical protein